MVNRGPGGAGAGAGVTLSSEQDRPKRTLVHRAIAGGRALRMYVHSWSSSVHMQKQRKRSSVSVVQAQPAYYTYKYYIKQPLVLLFGDRKRKAARVGA